MAKQPFSAAQPRSLPTISPNQPIEQTLAIWRTQLQPLVQNAAPQPTPLNFSATNARGGINLSWSPVAGGDGYEILKSLNGSFTDDLQVIPVKDVRQSTFFDGLGGNSKTAHYRIRTTSGTANNPQSQRGPESGTVRHTSIDASDTKSVPTTVADVFTTDKTRALSRNGNYGAIKPSPLGKAGGSTVASGTSTLKGNPAGTPATGSTSFGSIGSGTNNSATIIVGSGAQIVPDSSSPGVIDATEIQGTPATTTPPVDGQILQYSVTAGQLIYVTPSATVAVNALPVSLDSAVEVNNLNAVMGYVSPITVNTPPRFIPNHAVSVNRFPMSDDYSVTVNAPKPWTVNGV